MTATTWKHTAAFALAMLVLMPGAALAQDAGELVSLLSKDLGVTTDQARGGAGSLFSLAKGKLAPADFGKVAGAVPGIDGLMAAAPALGASSKLGTLAAATAAFNKLGLAPAMVSKFIPILTQFVGKTGGADVAALLAGALK